MSAAILVTCDGLDGDCTQRIVIPRATTPTEARNRIPALGWTVLPHADLCRDCTIDPHRRATPHGITPDTHWSDR